MNSPLFKKCEGLLFAFQKNLKLKASLWREYHNLENIGDVFSPGVSHVKNSNPSDPVLAYVQKRTALLARILHLEKKTNFITALLDDLEAMRVDFNTGKVNPLPDDLLRVFYSVFHNPEEFSSRGMNDTAELLGFSVRTLYRRKRLLIEWAMKYYSDKVAVKD